MVSSRISPPYVEERAVPRTSQAVRGLGSGPELALAWPSQGQPQLCWALNRGCPGCLIRGSAGHARQPLEKS